LALDLPQPLKKVGDTRFGFLHTRVKPRDGNEQANQGKEEQSGHS
jgi:hypothetical protein